MTRLVIAINNLNDARFLPECIAAIRAQTCQAFELYGIDAGSTDNSVEVYRRHGVEVVDCTGLSQPASVNRVIRRTESDLFAWINADDIYEPCFVSEHFRAFDEHLTAEIVYTDWHWFRNAAPAKLYPIRAQAVETFLPSAINRIIHPTTMIRRRLFDAIGFFDESILYPFDFEFWLRAWRAGKTLLRWPVATARWRNRPDNLSHTKNPEILKEIDVLKARYGIGGQPSKRDDHHAAGGGIRRKT